MTIIYVSDHCKLKSYSATTAGAKSVVTIKIETTDHYDLGYLLRELAEIEAQQKLPKAPKPKTAKKAPPQLALPAPLLGLPYYGSEQE